MYQTSRKTWVPKQDGHSVTARQWGTHGQEWGEQRVKKMLHGKAEEKCRDESVTVKIDYSEKFKWRGDIVRGPCILNLPVSFSCTLMSI